MSERYVDCDRCDERLSGSAPSAEAVEDFRRYLSGLECD